MKEASIVIAGVGGQGSIRASHIVANAAIEEGLHARVGETFGAAMRGGSVASHVRIGEEIYSPLNPKNGAEVILSLEPMEGLRNAVQFLSKDGLFLTNTETWSPYDVNIGEAEYPSVSSIKESVKKIGKVKILDFNATELAQKAGNIRTMNVVMLGALESTGKLPIDSNTLKETIKANVPKGTEEANMNAFELGIKAIK
ncbi:MAG: indolepyruvate oxidoreductase subunit beta [Hadesarchaea archaeon]|nr:indolepyruvate oxidoreductase subunit beta [Hadesarchaea archaeon]